MPLPPRLFTSSRSQKEGQGEAKGWTKAGAPATWTNLDHSREVLTGVWGGRQHSPEIPGHATPNGLYLSLLLPSPSLPALFSSP